MTLLDLRGGVPAELAPLDGVYLLGVGGPEDESGIGDVDAFVWRCAVVERGSDHDVALMFSTMPRLMAFTRTVNGAEPFTVPTEALRVAPADISAVEIFVALDPEPEMLQGWLAEGATVAERSLPALEGHP